MAHLLFLSHAGADTERALHLAAAIEASPEAQAAGLKVWLDKRPDGPHRLQAGTPWQDQLERAIASESTAFGLLLTREGARNWVRLEVRVALDRVIAAQRVGAVYPFVPIIADDPGDLAHLPPFAQQYQGVRLTSDGQGLADLVRTAARLDAAQTVRLVAQPFMGLEAFEAKDAALFFGRRKETQDLVDRLRTTNLVLVTGDSGSGKSSLVKAGLIPAFREGALADPLGRRPEPGQWHVVEMRPGTDPFEGLVEGAQRAAIAAGIAPEMIFALGAAIRSRDPGAIRDAMRQSGPPGASLLLVVDQFEELWTLTLDDTKRRDFLSILLTLVPEGDLTRRIVGTMRRDYYHLHTDDEHLRDRLAANGNAGRFLLGAMAPESLRDIVEKPLLLAGESEARAAALAHEVVKDVAGEPGNLALVEMALRASWERRYEKENSGDLARAYQRLDRLEGALAREAEDVFWNPANDPKKLTGPERPIAEALFMRLVRAGDAGSATRRPVSLAELEEPARTVARKLATSACRRLLVLREPDGNGGESAITVELAHEQLVTQWPDYRFWLRGTGSTRHDIDIGRAADKRAFDRLTDAAENWNGRGRKEEDLARGGELAEFKWLRTASLRNLWLSTLEREFVDRSVAADKAAETKREQQVETLRELARTRRRQTWGARVAAGLLFAVAGVAIGQWQTAISARNDATNQQKKAEDNARSAALAKRQAEAQQLAAEANAQRADAQLSEAKRIDSRRLANLSLQATEAGDAVTGILLALHALPVRFNPPDRPLVADVWLPLRTALVDWHELDYLPLGGPVYAAKFSEDGTKIYFCSKGKTFDEQLHWFLESTAEGASGFPADYGPDNDNVQLSFDGSRIIVPGTYHASAYIWKKSENEAIELAPKSRLQSVGSFSHDGSRVVIITSDNNAQIWHTNGEENAIILHGHSDVVRSADFSRDDTHVVTTSNDGTARVWRADGAGAPVVLGDRKTATTAAAFSSDGTMVAVAFEDGTVRVWHADGTGQPVVMLGHHDGLIHTAAFSPDGTRVVTSSDDKTARIWRSDGRSEPVVLRGHSDKVRDANFSPDGKRVVTASDDGTARVWRADGAEQALLLRKVAGPVFPRTIVAEATRLVTIGSHKVGVWPLDSSAKPAVLSLTNNTDAFARSVASSADGTRIVIGFDDGTIQILTCNGRDQSVVLRADDAQIRTVALSADGSLAATVSLNGAVRVWRSDGTDEPIVLPGDGDFTSAIAFTRDNTHVVTAGRSITVRRADGTGEPSSLGGIPRSDYATSVAFSPDSTRVVTGSEKGVVTIYSTDGTFEPIRLFGHSDGVMDVGFSPDGTRIVTASLDGTARVWLVNDPSKPIVLRAPEAKLTAAGFSADGNTAITASWDGITRVWPLVGSLEQLTAYARSLALPRELTPEQKKEYFILEKW